MFEFLTTSYEYLNHHVLLIHRMKDGFSKSAKSTKSLFKGRITVDLDFSFSIPGLFLTWNSNKPGFEKLNSRSEPGFGKLNSRSELELSKKTIITEKKVQNLSLTAES